MPFRETVQIAQRRRTSFGDLPDQISQNTGDLPLDLGDDLPFTVFEADGSLATGAMQLQLDPSSRLGLSNANIEYGAFYLTLDDVTVTPPRSIIGTLGAGTIFNLTIKRPGVNPQTYEVALTTDLTFGRGYGPMPITMVLAITSSPNFSRNTQWYISEGLSKTVSAQKFFTQVLRATSGLPTARYIVDNVDRAIWTSPTTIGSLQCIAAPNGRIYAEPEGIAYARMGYGSNARINNAPPSGFALGSPTFQRGEREFINNVLDVKSPTLDQASNAVIKVGREGYPVAPFRIGWSIVQGRTSSRNFSAQTMFLSAGPDIVYPTAPKVTVTNAWELVFNGHIPMSPCCAVAGLDTGNVPGNTSLSTIGEGSSLILLQGKRPLVISDADILSALPSISLGNRYWAKLEEETYTEEIQQITTGVSTATIVSIATWTIRIPVRDVIFPGNLLLDRLDRFWEVVSVERTGRESEMRIVAQRVAS